MLFGSLSSPINRPPNKVKRLCFLLRAFFLQRKQLHGNGRRVSSFLPSRTSPSNTMSLPLLSICVEAVGKAWDSLPHQAREALPPSLLQMIFNYMIKSDLVAHRDITILLPSFIKRHETNKQEHGEGDSEDTVRNRISSALSPSLDLSGCKTLSDTTLDQIAAVCPDLQEIVMCNIFGISLETDNYLDFARNKLN